MALMVLFEQDHERAVSCARQALEVRFGATGRFFRPCIEVLSSDTFQEMIKEWHVFVQVLEVPFARRAGTNNF
jgi:hypothetical protein